MPSSAGYVDPKDSLERCIHISEVQRGYQEARQQIFIEYDNESASLCALSEEPEQEAKAGETARVEAAKARSEAIVRREHAYQHGSSESMRTKFDNSFFYGPKSGTTNV
jgi:hypothetical protein